MTRCIRLGVRGPAPLRVLLLSCAFVFVVTAAAPVSAQSLDLEVPAETVEAADAPSEGAAETTPGVPAGASEEAWLRLTEIRLENHRQRRNEGIGLLSWGVAGALSGVVIAIAGRDDSALLAFGLTNLSFAAANIPLGLGSMDLRGRRRADIDARRYGEEVTLESVREAAIRAQLGKRLSYAVNGAFDVSYILTGVLMVVLAGRTRYENSVRGAGWSMITQGAGLLVYDFYGVVRASQRARSLRPNQLDLR